MKNKIIDSILNNCNVGLKPSSVCNGVGVFAIKPIKIGDILFKDVNPDSTYIKFTEISDINDDVLNYLKSMCNTNENGIFLSRTVNNINISYFVNHSDNPNVEHDLELDRFKAIRDINIGEELLCIYTEIDKNNFLNQ